MENNYNELEQMREQMQLLRSKLDKQEIINDNMLRRSVNKEMSWIKILVYTEFLLIPICARFWYSVKEVFDLSWSNYAFMIVMCTVDAVLDYYVNIASLKIKNGSEYSLTQTMQKLISMKQIRAKQFYIMLSLSAVWFVWTGIEMWQFAGSISEMDDLMQFAIYGGIGGLVIGIPLSFYVAIRIYRKMQRTNDELIEQIRDFS